MLKTLRDFATTNVTTKLMALVIAVILWFYAFYFSKTFMDMDLPLVIAVPEGWSVVSAPLQKIPVTVSVPKASEETIKYARDRGQLEVRYDVTVPENAQDEFTLEVGLTGGDFLLPSGIGAGIADFSPKKFTITVARLDVKTLAVKPVISAAPAGYTTGKPFYWPPAVAVKGPKRILDQVSVIETEPIDLSAVSPRWPFRGSVALRPCVTVNNEDYEVEVRREISFEITFEPLPRTRRFPDVPVRQFSPWDYAYSAAIEPSQKKMWVEVSGPQAIVDALKTEDVALYVDVSSLKPAALPQQEQLQWVIRGAGAGAELKVVLERENVNVSVAEKNAHSGE